MTPDYKPEILTDKSRLPEIYHLRVAAYENSPKSIFVNREIFPDGMSDELDERETTLHYIIKDNDKIVASARIAVLNDIKDIDEPVEENELPLGRPFAYYTRLVVHPDYRGLGLSAIMDKVRSDYLRAHKDIHFALAWATSHRKQSLLNVGFRIFTEYEYEWEGNTVRLDGYILS